MFIEKKQSSVKDILKLYDVNDKLRLQESINENMTKVQESSENAPWFPYTLDYSLGSVFYIPSDYETSVNFECNIINIPTDTTKVYLISLIFYQPNNKVYCDKLQVIDAKQNYIFGSTDKYLTPLFENGQSTLLRSPNLVLQQFFIVSVPDSIGNITRYVTSKISDNY